MFVVCMRVSQASGRQDISTTRSMRPSGRHVAMLQVMKPMCVSDLYTLSVHGAAIHPLRAWGIEREFPVINPPPLPLLLHRHHHHQPAHHQGCEDTSMPSRPTSGLFLLYFWHNVPCLEQRVYVVRVSLSSCRATSAVRCRYWYHGHVYVPVLSVQFNATAEPSSKRLGGPPLYMN